MERSTMSEPSAIQTQTETVLETDVTDSGSQVFEDPHVKHMKMVQEVEQSTGKKVKVVGPPVTYSYATNKVRLAPPMLGQHTEEILRNVLNYSDNKIQILKTNKVVQ